jgi:hypothetical protein
VFLLKPALSNFRGISSGKLLGLEKPHASRYHANLKSSPPGKFHGKRRETNNNMSFNAQLQENVSVNLSANVRAKKQNKFILSGLGYQKSILEYELS